MPYAFADLTQELQQKAGAKGGTLARLLRAGYPVPDGLVILPEEFAGDELSEPAKRCVLEKLESLRYDARESQKEGEIVPYAFAVRSSALEEDSGQASFAGAFATVLDVSTDDEVLAAIAKVRASRHDTKAAAYARARGLGDEHQMGVIVQRLIRADFAGVLFTADPVTGNLMKMQGNFVPGLGDQLVAGESMGQSFTFDRPSGKYRGPKQLEGTGQLRKAAEKLDKLMGTSVDIEWAIRGGKLSLLQVRPIASMREFNPVTGETNSSLIGDFLWSNGNAAEIQPEVQPLFTQSMVKLWGDGYGTWWSRYPAGGVIGGRSYFNITIQVAPFARLPGGLKGAMRYVGDWWGRIPADVTVPLAPFTRREVFFHVLPMFFRSGRRFAGYRRKIPGFVEKTPGWCREMRGMVRQASDARALTALWRDHIKPYFCFGTAMASAANTAKQVGLQKDLAKLVGEDDANALLSNLGGKSALASVEPMLALARVAHGTMTREEYLDECGHRGPYEFDPSRPQPIDDPRWLDRQLADFGYRPYDAEAMLAKQRAAFDAAWQRFVDRYPKKAKSMKARIDEVTTLSALREAGRSEVTRIVGVIRAWALRAGEVTGVGDDVFHMTIDELLAALGGDGSARRYIPKRKETFARYRALPPYPAVISGRFDPFAWAADPNRRSDVFDAHAPSPAPAPGADAAITGFPGAAGVVEGIVRRIDRFEDGHNLKPGEILLTSSTNVGWTPLFPRAAAIVTDVGAPLSHAAIVARELGIPAVIGCCDATMRLRTGDRVRVNGGQGRVEILAKAEDLAATVVVAKKGKPARPKSAPKPRRAAVKAGDAAAKS